MSTIRSQSSIVDLFCLLPDEWKDHPSEVTRKILVEEFQSHLQAYQTVEGLVINIDNVTARSQVHSSSVWFRMFNDDDDEPDLMKYYPMKILFYGEITKSQISELPFQG
ncbi:hypothetical protein KQX54_017150 [Cotesia glomerata]|uniref:Uncharacterized protein n=1 Tax=Cotesia glomerata TaxID=32391 RepID=A0AAV7I7A7_COTGL|nr:hypothetical protein KQX54_017145 [Cotesia glomerata]KAH0547114.1 hypothetical protein KQX54_017150 [Cotesia glomerata]